MLRPNEKAQLEMIISGLAEILIRAAEGDEAVFALPGQGTVCFNDSDQGSEKIIIFDSILTTFITRVILEGAGAVAKNDLSLKSYHHKQIQLA